jgi:hypothetical protein
VGKVTLWKNSCCVAYFVLSCVWMLECVVSVGLLQCVSCVCMLECVVCVGLLQFVSCVCMLECVFSNIGRHLFLLGIQQRFLGRHSLGLISVLNDLNYLMLFELF